MKLYESYLGTGLRLGCVMDCPISQVSFGPGAAVSRHSCQTCSQIRTISALRTAKQNRAAVMAVTEI